MPTDPDEIGCDFFTQVDARVPYVRGDLGDDTTDPDTILQGSLVFSPGGLPLGTRLSVDAEPVRRRTGWRHHPHRRGARTRPARARPVATRRASTRRLDGCG